MKKASEQTIIKVLVNLKTIGCPGKCLRAFPKSEKLRILDELLRRGYVDEHMNVLPAARPVILANLSLSE